MINLMCLNNYIVMLIVAVNYVMPLLITEKFGILIFKV